MLCKRGRQLLWEGEGATGNSLWVVGWPGSSANLVEGEVGSNIRVHKKEGDISFDVLRF